MSSEPDNGRRRFSITLSDKTAEAFEWLKLKTDADTDSEVFRNALRLHHVLLQAHEEGDRLLIRRQDEGDLLTIVDLFLAK